MRSGAAVTMIAVEGRVLGPAAVAVPLPDGDVADSRAASAARPTRCASSGMISIE